MRIAVIGTGISGLLAARLLCRDHDLTVAEADHRLGGHTHTQDFSIAGQSRAIDSGFIVFNRRTYPTFCRMLAALGVAARDSDMSFSVRRPATGLEWNGRNLGAIFAQRRRLLSFRHWRMVSEILRFNRLVAAIARDPGTATAALTMGEFLDRHGFSRYVSENYVHAMASAIWSAPVVALRRFPIGLLARFFDNHGMLSVEDRPTWLTVVGGSRSYIGPLTAPFADRIRLGRAATAVRRLDAGGVEVAWSDGSTSHHDAVVLATHADTALNLIHEASAAERDILSAFPYQENTAVIHTDAAVMPRTRRAWASWNQIVSEDPTSATMVTYHCNRLQGLGGPDVFVTLNPQPGLAPREDTVLRRITYHHPQYLPRAGAAQARHDEINGRDRLYFCGAYWRFGFHEDGAWSAVQAVAPLGADWDRAFSSAGTTPAAVGAGA